MTKQIHSELVIPNKFIKNCACIITIYSTLAIRQYGTQDTCLVMLPEN